MFIRVRKIVINAKINFIIFLGLKVTQEDANVLVILKYVVYVIAQLIHIFCFSFEGQKLIDHSLQTRDTM